MTRLVKTTYVLLLPLLGIGCESPTWPAPLPPSPSPQPQAEYSVAGTVQDTAYRFIPDVRIQVVEGSAVGVSTMSDPSGRFALPGAFTGEIVVRAEKAGYISETQRVRHGPSFRGQWPLNFGMQLDAPSPTLVRR